MSERPARTTDPSLTANLAPRTQSRSAEHVVTEGLHSHFIITLAKLTTLRPLSNEGGGILGVLSYRGVLR